MANPDSKTLVIDASVLRAAGGEDAVYPVSVYCRDFLQNVLTICHKAAISMEILEEWDKHISRKSILWYLDMSVRDKLDRIPKTSSNTIINKIKNIVSDEHIQQILLKDSHLVNAALEKDRTIISLDDKARFHYSNLSRSDEDLSSIVWINPSWGTQKDFDTILQWLQRGAKPLKKWTLGYHTP